MNPSSLRAAAKARAIEWTLVGAAVGLVLAMLTGYVKAEDYNINFGTSGYAVSGPNGATIVAPLGSSAPHIIHVPPGTFRVDPVHDLRWLARCRPHLRMGNYGVQYYVYAKPGCEYGADRDEAADVTLPKNED